jgi:hypothetical protein
MAGGRPLKFQTVKELEDKIELYFDSFKKGGENEGKPMLVSGLAYHLDICTTTLFSYEKNSEFLAPIKKAKQRVEMQYENGLHQAAPTGSIFALKNFKWKDKSEQDLNNRYVDKEGKDLHTKDLEIINNYEQRIRSQKDD